MKFHSPVMIVKDIEKSKQFYIDVLEQSIEHDFGKNIIFDSGFAIWEPAPDHVIPKHLQTTATANQFELYFEDENIDRVYAKLQKADVEFLHGIHEEPWGQRTIRFFDPDHHLIEVGEPLHTFVRNMYDSGLSAEAISKKSGISLDTVKILLGEYLD